ncbi:MAG: hypothetical protein PHH12_03300 [Candidatus Shapirobacteria bacterium]|jgi:hypothetical protein|nr:hypothetical protein [Candidatus Shapirobacteria bacterium]
MGYDLSNKQKEYFRFAQSYWSKVLKIAANNGWKAKGTIIPKNYKHSDWNGNYYENSGQIVADDDAINLGQALLKSIKILSQKTIPEPKMPSPKDEVAWKKFINLLPEDFFQTQTVLKV